MKNTYGTETGSCGIIIKRISNASTQMACKILQKLHREEVSMGVVTTIVYCANNTMLNWAPYLLNMFLDNYKDVQDLGT
jgi:hypothetical protein